MTLYAGVLVILIGLYALVTQADLVRKIIGMAVFNGGVVLCFVHIGYRRHATAPIMEPGVEAVVDPVPQALILTAIVIGICLTALALALAVKIHEAYGTVDVHTLCSAPPVTEREADTAHTTPNP